MSNAYFVSSYASGLRSDQVTRFKSTKKERAKIGKGLTNEKNSPWVGKAMRKGHLHSNPYSCGLSVAAVGLGDVAFSGLPIWGSCSLGPDYRVHLLFRVHNMYNKGLAVSLFSKGLRTVKSITPKCRLGFSRVLNEALDKVICKPDDIACRVSLLEESITNAIQSWGVPGGSVQLVRETLAESASPILDLDEEDFDLNEQNLKQCKRKIYDSHYTAVVRVLSSSGVASYNDATLQELKAKHPFKSAPSFPNTPIDHCYPIFLIHTQLINTPINKLLEPKQEKKIWKIERCY
uniref:Putative reverse transcriptase domain-containing protein n=1 Tax=Tanacetum cinerariifolium TaxID=118510 RepID=A0A6L2MCQ2_TANCI|nr:putative reverse transcriptase domain-containing protein [Tanacetum cinerariifolium]